MKKPKTFPLENDGKIRDTLQKLRARNKKLEKENKELRSKISTLEDAFRRTKTFLKDSTDEFSVEKCIDAAKKNKTLKEMQKETDKCPTCSSVLKQFTGAFGEITICENKTCQGKKVQRKSQTVCDA